MPLIPREKIDDVRDRTNIVEVIKRYVELKRAGTGSWKGLCPFHAEKTPSFHVHEVRQFFHCFGCGEKGDVFGFLAKIEQRSFTEVLRDLAQQAGVELPEREQMSPAERRAREAAESERDRLLRVMDLATTFFEEQYASTAGVAARAYVEGRGIGPEVRARFRVGYAPPNWGALMEHLARHKVSPTDAERLGLVGTNERGRYDFFRDRVMLPVFDRQKRVVGFGSRLLDPEAKDRKYVNSPDSPLFHKKECLYGLHTALDAIRKKKRVIVVEGNFDVLTLHQAGFEETVAPMGTALTADQISLLTNMALNVFVIFDGDAAGIRASGKAAPMFATASWSQDLVSGGAKVARLPEGVDPDDFIRSRGAAAFERVLESARHVIDQAIQDAMQDASVSGRIASLEHLASLLLAVQKPAARKFYAEEVSGKLGLKPQDVARAIREAQDKLSSGGKRLSELSTPVESQGRVQQPAIEERGLPADERQFLALIATYPEVASTDVARRGGELLVDMASRQLFRTMMETISTTNRLDIAAWLDSGPPAVRKTISSALMDDGISRSANPPTTLRAVVARLELQRVEAEIGATTRLLAQAQSSGDAEARLAAMKRHMDLQKARLGLKQALERP